MSIKIELYNKDTSNLTNDLFGLLEEVDSDFIPSLSSREPLTYWMDLFLTGEILYAIEDRRILGFLVYYPRLTENIKLKLNKCVNMKLVYSGNRYNEGYLHFIGVAKTSRGRKIASRLLEKLLIQLQNKNISTIRVITWSSNNYSLSLYRKFGFVQYAIAEGDRSNGDDTVYLQKFISLNNQSKYIVWENGGLQEIGHDKISIDAKQLKESLVSAGFSNRDTVLNLYTPGMDYKYLTLNRALEQLEAVIIPLGIKQADNELIETINGFIERIDITAIIVPEKFSGYITRQMDFSNSSIKRDIKLATLDNGVSILSNVIKGISNESIR